MAAKFKIEKFDGNNDSGLWRLKMHALLVQNGLHKALRGKNALSEKLSDEEKDKLLEKAYGQIVLFFSDGVLRKVVQEKTVAGIWQKLENLYITKSLTNRLYLKKRLFTLQMQENGRSDYDSDNALSVIENGIRPKDEWILDSGCSYHMCPNRNWFITYREINGGNVLMGNNVACKTVGIGIVKIKMYDGIVRKLAEVWHVPDPKKNLISLSA